MPPEVLKPEQLKKVATDSTNPLAPAPNASKLANQTLNDLNEVLKTADSILSKFGTSLATLIKKKETEAPKEAYVAQKIEAGIEKRQNEVVNNMQRANPEAYVKPEIKIDAPNATLEVLKMLHELGQNNPEMKLSEAVELVKEWNTAGILEGQIDKWMRKWVSLI